MKTRRVFLTMLSTSAVVAACTEEQLPHDDGAGEGGMASAGGGGNGVGAGVAQGGAGGSEPMGLLVVGDLSDLSEGALFGVAEPSSLFLGLDEDGVYAMTSICTHKQCDIVKFGAVLGNGGRRCTCHDSRFDVNGAVTLGPALQPLARYYVELDGGTILVDKAIGVDAAFRAALPGGAGGGGAGGDGGAGGGGADAGGADAGGAGAGGN